MKASLQLNILGLLLGLATVAAGAEAGSIRYEVAAKDAPMATQTVSIIHSPGLTTISAAFEIDLPVFVAMHHYSENLSVSFRPDGTVERMESFRSDGGDRVAVSGTLQANGLLRVFRTDMDGCSTNLIARADYDFNSLILYGIPPAQFLPTNSPARVLSIAEGRIIPISIQTISESETFERQNLVSQHLVWTEGIHTSHSWHPERFSDLPRRYIRQTENGEFTFNLIR